MAQKTLLNSAEVKQAVGYKDNKSVVALIQRDLGGFKIGGRWRVHIGKLELYLTKKYNPSVSDRVAEMLKPRRVSVGADGNPPASGKIESRPPSRVKAAATRPESALVPSAVHGGRLGWGSASADSVPSENNQNQRQ